jgi:hypothetical protein
MQINGLKDVKLKMRKCKNKKWCKLARGVEGNTHQTNSCKNKALL